MADTTSIQELILRFLIDFSKILQSIKMYPSSHPVVRKGITDVTALAAEIFTHVPQVSIGVKDGVLIIEDAPVKETHASLHSFLQTLGRKNIDSFILKKGVSEDEVASFVRLVTAKDEEVLVEGRIRPDLLKQFTHININEIQYRRISGKEETGKGKGAGASQKTVWDEAEIAEALLGSKDAESPAFRRQLAELMAKGPQASAMILEKALWKLTNDKDRKEAASSCMERMGKAFATSGKGVGELKDALRQLVLALGPQTQRVVWGKKIERIEDVDVDKLVSGFSTQAKATLLKSDVLKKDITEEGLKSAILSLVSSESEIAGLAEFISKEIGQSGLPLDQVKGALTRFFASAQSMAQPPPPVTAGGTVYIAEEDPETGKEYGKLLADLKYQPVTCAGGDELLSLVRKKKPDLVITGIRIKGITGLEIISELQRDRAPVPVIISTSFSAFETAFEIKTYPKLRFFLKPVAPKGLLKAVQELTYKPEESVIKEDLSRAKKIQEGLLPKSLPALSGYDIYAYYRASSDVGGDYYDIIPIDGKRWGMVIADVSGKGVSGAMVMVMVRSILRTVAERGIPAREVIIETNRLLAKDLQSGMFITAIYLILDTEKGEVSVCRAGHNPLLLWNGNSRKVTPLAPSGMALGLIEDAQFFAETLEEEKITLSPGDRVSIFTDGITEAMNVRQEEFGEERLNRLLSDYAGRSSRELTDKILEEIDAHQSNFPQSDDITFLTLARK